MFDEIEVRALGAGNHFKLTADRSLTIEVRGEHAQEIANHLAGFLIRQPVESSVDKMREAFEAQYWDFLGGNDRFKEDKLHKLPRGAYRDPKTAAAWWAWEAALTQQPEIDPPLLGGVIVTDAQMDELRQRHGSPQPSPTPATLPQSEQCERCGAKADHWLCPFCEDKEGKAREDADESAQEPPAGGE